MQGRAPGGLRLWTPMAFAGWTVFVWLSRYRNLDREPGPLTDVPPLSLAGALGFAALGAALAASLALARDQGGQATWWPRARALVVVLAALTVVVWPIRVVGIVGGGHSIGFVVVHVGLALVSMGLAVAAYRQVGGPGWGEARSSLLDDSDRSAAGYPPTDG